MSKILVIACRAKPFNHEKCVGGLDSVQKTFIENLHTVYDIDFLGFGNEDFGPYKDHINVIDSGLPLVGKFTPQCSAALRKTLKSIDFDQYSKIVAFEMLSTTIDIVANTGNTHKLINIVATPYDPTIRGIVNLWKNVVKLHRLGGQTIVSTRAFKALSRKYPFMKQTVVTNELLKKGELEYWQDTDIISDKLFPPTCIHEMPIISDSDNTVVSAQRWDTKFRKTNVAVQSMENSDRVIKAFMSADWAPPKRWLDKDWVYIDKPHSEVKAALSSALVSINTCHDTGTIEHASLEAISNGTPVLQLLLKGYEHATLEYDPTTKVVEITDDMSTKDIIGKYTKALVEFKDTYEDRVARATRLYAKYNFEEYKRLWSNILDT